MASLSRRVFSEGGATSYGLEMQPSTSNGNDRNTRGTRKKRPSATVKRVRPQRMAASLIGRLMRTGMENCSRNGVIGSKTGPENHRRGVHLEELVPVSIRAVEILRDEVDAPRALALWNEACTQCF